ncbi:hypothetical protein [Brucella intermedia]|uniref:hypothetical protein n=1 Tax=Brucella intermedia TaxID=94625 RepID=UPI0007C64D74|nr:hypothetical protein [Brucella intermedia]OAE39683.1 hypothetical protein A7J42_14345 [Brucella intermedia]
MVVGEHAVKAAQKAYRECEGDSTESHRAALTAALPFLPVQGAVQADAFKLIERMAFGYEVMFEKLCHISGTSGVDQSWYRAKAREATERLSPLHSITTESNKSVPGDCKRQYQDFMARVLSALEPSAAQPDPWVVTRLVRFDDTIVFGRGGFDFDRWESLRWEMHTRHGSFAVWKSESKTWSMYGGKYGFLMLDRFSSEEEAKAEAEQIVISLDAEPSAARTLALEEAARNLIAVRYDTYTARNGKLCSIEGDDGEKAWIVPFDAMAELESALSSPDHADAGKVEGDGWSMSLPKFHRYPYFVENISGKWCLCKHHGNGASHTISVHETAREARDAAPASEGAE